MYKALETNSILTENRPLIAVTMGDPAGIGPETIIKAFQRNEFEEICRVLVIGDKISLEDGYQVEFEDGFNRKPVVIDADNPFEGDNLSDNFSNPSVDLEEESDDDSPFS